MSANSLVTTNCPSVTVQFLSALFLFFTLGGSIGIAQKPGFHARWFDANAAGIDEAAAYAAQMSTDVYFHCATHDPEVAAARSREKAREQGKEWTGSYGGCEESARELGFLWADIDLADKPDAKKRYPTREFVLEMLRRLPVPPSLVIDSGNGMHVYWLLAKPLDAQAYKDLPARWQAYLKSQLVDAATGEGYDLDPTGDTARILRVPGTLNSKGGKPVQIVELHEGRRYEAAQFEALTAPLAARERPGPRRRGGDAAASFVLNPACEAPAVLERLSQRPVFRALWEHRREDLEGDQSRYDLHIGWFAAKYGCSNQEIVDLLVVNRRAHGDEAKTHREDYYRRTLAKIRERAGGGEDEAAVDYPAYVYVIGIKRFIDLQTLVDYDKEQFNDLHQSALGSRGAANEFLERADTVKVQAETYRPDAPRIVTEDGALKLNRWRPSKIVPAPGDVSVFLEHVAYLFANDPTAGEHLLDRLAYLVQHPGEKVHSVPLLIGKPGIGKDTLGVAIRRVLGEHNTREVDNEELKSAYTDWLLNASLIIVGELMTCGRREIMNRLKPLITQPEVRIARKFMSTVTMPNRTNFLLFSNYTDAARLEEGDRRYFVHISKAEPREPAYYQRLWDFINRDASIAALAHYLLNRDLSGFNPNAHAPMTESKAEVIRESLSPVEMVLQEMYEADDGAFAKDLVVVDPIVNHLKGIKRLEANHHTVTRFLRRIGGVCLGQKRVDGTKHRVWAIRRAELWAQASEARIAGHLKHGESAEPGKDGPPIDYDELYRKEAETARSTRGRV